MLSHHAKKLGRKGDTFTLCQEAQRREVSTYSAAGFFNTTTEGIFRYMKTCKRNMLRFSPWLFFFHLFLLIFERSEPSGIGKSLVSHLYRVRAICFFKKKENPTCACKGIFRALFHALGKLSFVRITILSLFPNRHSFSP